MAESDRARALRFSASALELLVAYDWPGNVRELESAVEYATLRARGTEIAPEDLPRKFRAEGKHASHTQLPRGLLADELVSLDELERRYLIHVLNEVEGNRTRAAEVLGIDRRTLYRMAERFGIKL